MVRQVAVLVEVADDAEGVGGQVLAKRVSKKVEIGVEVYRRDKGVGRNVGV